MAAHRWIRLGERAFALIQYALPTRFLSSLAHRVACSRRPWIARPAIALFMRAFGVSLTDARQRNANDYASFNAFFTRALTPDARPLPTGNDTLICPVDGRISQFGDLHGGRIIQAKGRDYSATELLGGADAGAFDGGRFCTLYLAPSNYHRVHMPWPGRLLETRLVPGRLFSVNPATVRNVPRLFARNERLVCLFDTGIGPMAVVLVGAMLVGSIETVWAGGLTPPHAARLDTRHFPERGAHMIQLARGEELGRFNMGSSVVILLPRSLRWLPGLTPGQPMRMGQALGDFSA